MANIKKDTPCILWGSFEKVDLNEAKYEFQELRVKINADALTTSHEKTVGLPPHKPLLKDHAGVRQQQLDPGTQLCKKFRVPQGN